jgi:hypothetical protein
MIVLRILGFIWALPTTLFGVIWALCRGSRFEQIQPCRYGWMVTFKARPDTIDQRYFIRIRFRQWELGETVCVRAEYPMNFLHAERHVFWGAILGPLYLPVYWIGYAIARGYKNNFIEVDCRRYAGET